MDTETRQIHNFLAGDLFDRHYRLLEHVGSGGFADVWKAKDELVDTIVALLTNNEMSVRMKQRRVAPCAARHCRRTGLPAPRGHCASGHQAREYPV